MKCGYNKCNNWCGVGKVCSAPSQTLKIILEK